MMYDIDQFLRSFSDRILINGKIIEENATILNDGYEITQRIISLTALLTVCVGKFGETQEEYRNDKNKQYTIFDLNSAPFQDIEKLIRELKEQKRLYSNYRDFEFSDGTINVLSFIIHLRNSLAHGGTGLSFFPIDQGNVNDITDIYLRDSYKTSLFCTKLSVLPLFTGSENKQSKDHVTRLIDDISAIYKGKEKSKNGNYLAKQYKKQIDLLDKALQGG